MRHIGNDEVQIIWSDHYRDYDRKIMPTQFGDVIVCVYPTEPKGLYRIQIIRRDNIPSFGPLYDGAVVDEENLAGLVRNTALNAGRACRKDRTGFKYFFEERADYLRTLIQNYTEEETYEQFFSSVISPQPAEVQVSLTHCFLCTSSLSKEIFFIVLVQAVVFIFVHSFQHYSAVEVFEGNCSVEYKISGCISCRKKIGDMKNLQAVLSRELERQSMDYWTIFLLFIIVLTCKILYRMF